MRNFKNWRYGLGLAATLGWLVVPLLPAAEAPPTDATTAPKAATPANGTADKGMHEFTNQAGVKIKAELVNFMEPDVYLKREDGAAFKVSISLFSVEDQAYIRQQSLALAKKNGDEIFLISAASAKANNSTANANSRDTTKWDVIYKVKLENRSKVELIGARVDYLVFVETTGSANPQNKRIAISGQELLEPLAPDKKFEFSTKPAPLQKVHLTDGAKDDAIPKGTTTDDVMGIWVRIYGNSGEVVDEWASSPDFLKKEDLKTMGEAGFNNVEHPPARGAGGRRGGAGGQRGGGAGAGGGGGNRGGG